MYFIFLICASCLCGSTVVSGIATYFDYFLPHVVLWSSKLS
jgi:hypothetical protein